jgi:general secretion pathway protein C
VNTIDKLQSLQSVDLIRLLQGAWVKRAVLAANVLLILWIAWILATLTWSVIDEPEPVTALPAATTPASAVPDPERQKIREMTNWHLFGKVARETQVVKAVAPVEAPETRLKLVLRGAFASDDKEIARAIIADPRGKEEQYAVGEKLPGNAELSEIHPDKVILMRNGRYETLRLPEERNSSGSGRTRGASIRAGADAPASKAQRLKSMRRQLKENPKSLYGLVRATPKKDEAGNMVGYTLQPGREPELFQTMGLQEGDVVTGINEVKLDSLANGMKALKSAEAGESVTMTVLRGDQEETLTFSMPE